MTAWLVVLLLPWQPWRNTEILSVDHDRIYTDLSEVTVVIPARDESRVIRTTLEGLNSQGKNLKVIMVDDGSTDGTAEIAASSETPNLQIIPGSKLPEGWNGKIWALEQGVRMVTTRLTLLLDADIKLGPGVLAALMDKMKSDNRQLVSIMTSLKMKNGWEKLLMPAFIYFFKMLYPFKLAKSSNRRFFSAAGGCILLNTDILNQIGG
jgi:glycosyltransferase involved in cell wall biosynthesis